MYKKDNIYFAFEQLKKTIDQIESFSVNPISDSLNLHSKVYGTTYDTLSSINRMEKHFLSATKSFKDQNDLVRSQISSLGPLLSALDSIKIAPDYVEMPVTLIPDNFDFDCDEELNSTPHQSSVVKLSFEKAMALLGIVIPIIIAIVSSKQNQSPAPWQEQYHQEEMEQKNEERLQFEQYNDTLEEVLKYLKAIYNQLNDQSKSCTGCPCSDDGSNSQSTDSDPDSAESLHSTIPDSPDESDTAEPIPESD